MGKSSKGQPHQVSAERLEGGPLQPPMKIPLHPEWRGVNAWSVSTKQQSLSWLAELPEESSAWRELHDDARLLRDIAAAEDDVRNGRESLLAVARELLEQNGLNHPSILM